MLFGAEIPVLPLGLVVGLALLGIRQAMRKAARKERAVIELCMWVYGAGFLFLIGLESRPGRKWLLGLEAETRDAIRGGVVVTLALSTTFLAALGGGRWLAGGLRWPGADDEDDEDDEDCEDDHESKGVPRG